MDLATLSTIFVLLQQIVKADGEARQNRTRCHELAGRVQVVSNVLRDAAAAAESESGTSYCRGDDAEETRRLILCRLKKALNDALQLVKSCGRQHHGRLSIITWFTARLKSASQKACFNNVNKRINDCYVEVTVVNTASIEKSNASIVKNSAYIKKKIDQFVAASRRDHRLRTNKPDKEEGDKRRERKHKEEDGKRKQEKDKERNDNNRKEEKDKQGNKRGEEKDRKKDDKRREGKAREEGGKRREGKERKK